MRRPEAADRLGYEGPPHLTVRARPLALKRALANLVSNAVDLWRRRRGCGCCRRRGPAGRRWCEVEDDGPGIPPGELERVFEPFHRGEPSRNRETGGRGARPADRAQHPARAWRRRDAGEPADGGGGLKATVTLPG